MRDAFGTLLATGLATVVYYRVVARAGATFLSLINYLIPVFAVLAGVVFLGEEMTTRAVLALVVILSGILVSRRRETSGTAAGSRERRYRFRPAPAAPTRRLLIASTPTC